jgi:hypothetical protein
MLGLRSRGLVGHEHEGVCDGGKARAGKVNARNNSSQIFHQ